jgi:short-subunit dehydrogenase
MVKKIIVITGSTRGIGQGLALEFLKQKHQVVINGRNSEVVNEKVSRLKQKGFDVIGIAGDITDENTFQAIIEAATRQYKKIDIWINNAGIAQTNRHFDELDSQEIKHVASVNIVAMMLATQAAIKFFKKQGYGKVFNMEGFGSKGRMMEKLTLYGTTKRAVNYFTASISKEVKEKEIQVGVLSPGMVRTDFLKESILSGNQEDQAKTKKVFDVLAEDVDVVTQFLVKKILVSHKKYDRIEYLTIGRLMPKLIKMMFTK